VAANFNQSSNHFILSITFYNTHKIIIYYFNEALEVASVTVEFARWVTSWNKPTWINRKQNTGKWQCCDKVVMLLLFCCAL